MNSQFKIQTLGVAFLVVGVLTLPILIGIPFLLFGIYFFLFPNHALKWALKKNSKDNSSLPPDPARKKLARELSAEYDDYQNAGGKASVEEWVRDKARGPKYLGDNLSDEALAVKFQKLMRQCAGLPMDHISKKMAAELDVSLARFEKVSVFMARGTSGCNDHFADSVLLKKLRLLALRYQTEYKSDKEAIDLFTELLGVSTPRLETFARYLNDPTNKKEMADILTKSEQDILADLKQVGCE
jgi:hypothetical protein